MAEVIRLAKPAEDRSAAIAELRNLLKLLEDGQVKGFVAVYDDSEHWRFVWGATYANSVLLADILHDRAMERLKE